MEPDEIDPGAPVAGSPEVRNILSDPLGIAEPARRRWEISFAEAADELEFGLFDRD